MAEHRRIPLRHASSKGRQGLRPVGLSTLTIVSIVSRPRSAATRRNAPTGAGTFPRRAAASDRIYGSDTPPSLIPAESCEASLHERFVPSAIRASISSMVAETSSSVR